MDYVGAVWDKPCDEETAKKDLFKFFDMLNRLNPDKYLNFHNVK